MVFISAPLDSLVYGKIDLPPDELIGNQFDQEIVQ